MIADFYKFFKINPCDTNYKFLKQNVWISESNDLKIHEEVKQMKKIYNCVYCDKTFSNSGRQIDHMNAVHKGIKAHKCNQCGKAFGREEALRKHFKIVHEGLKTKCEFCGEYFSPYSIYQHKRYQHSDIYRKDKKDKKVSIL